MINIDVGWVDGSSLVLAALSGAIKPLRHWHSGTGRDIDSRKIVIDALSGASLMPFLLMIGAVISSDLLKTALETSKIFILPEASPA